ncbi:MAG: Pyruvate carboxylase subunit B [Methanocella sp. PtaU1.Bin125]|nr:MAG: Pyruvate carboxylase subunit B [Methanocella sp. PtaU1.Bin125]
MSNEGSDSTLDRALALDRQLVWVGVAYLAVGLARVALRFLVPPSPVGGAPIIMAQGGAAQAGPSEPVPDTETVSGNGAVTSPMQGTILKVNVKVGDSVKKGDVVAVLEAMKMENDIVAHSSGTVKSVFMQKGKNVDANAVLAVIE